MTEWNPEEETHGLSVQSKYQLETGYLKREKVGSSVKIDFKLTRMLLVKR